jgi:hypothetical protein
MHILGSKATVVLTALDPKSQDRDPNGYPKFRPQG